MSQLFSPYQLGELALANRIVIAPMCQYSAQDGCATDWHTIHLGHLALSGAALLFIEATAVEPEGRISPQDLGLWSDENEAALGRTLSAVKANSDMPIAIQLGHAGRKASVAPPWSGGGQLPLDQGGWQTSGPSTIPFDGHARAPRALSVDEISRLCERFAESARRSVRLGLDAIELHAAHGYLLHQFLSPLSNRRRGRLWRVAGEPDALSAGGLRRGQGRRAGLCPGRRPRLGQRLGRGRLGHRPDHRLRPRAEGPWRRLHPCLRRRHLGGAEDPARPELPGPDGARGEQASGLPTIAVGLITEADQAEAIIGTGDADLVALARGMLYDPRWPWHAAAHLGASIKAPNQYLRSQPRQYKTLFG